MTRQEMLRLWRLFRNRETDFVTSFSLISWQRARLRRNQRNSRARKQAYTRDLENRWNECVKLGAQATVEMQAVARKVQQENMLLRRILARQGFDQDTIQRALEIEKGMGEGYPRTTSQVCLKLFDARGSSLTEFYRSQRPSHRWKPDRETRH